MNTEKLFDPVRQYHVSLTTEKLIFADEVDKYHFLSMLGETTQVYGAHASGFCLLDKSIHVLMDTGDSQLGARQIVRDCFDHSYVEYYRERHGIQGPIHARSAQKAAPNAKRYLRWLYQMHTLPVTSGIVKRPDDYWWTSWQTYREHYEWPFIEIDGPLSLISEDREKALQQLRERQNLLLEDK